MQHPETRIFAVIAIGGLLATGLALSVGRHKHKTFDERFKDEVQQLTEVQPAIPYVKLHARALEILHEMTVAKDDPDAPAKVEDCVLDPQPLTQNACK
jgi:hypothetical protein